MELNRGISSHGTVRFAPLVRPDSVARVTLVAADDPTYTATWFKAAPPSPGLGAWFDADITPTAVCLDVALTERCTEGVISGFAAATVLQGMDLADHGYSSVGPLELRIENGTNVGTDLSGVSSQTMDFDRNAWPDHALEAGQWGNGLLLWVR
jgi:hypothetical protein